MRWEKIIKRPMMEFDERSRRTNFEYNPDVLINILETWDKGEEDIRVIRGPTIQQVDPSVKTEEGVLTESPRGAKKNLDWGFKFVTNRPITRALNRDGLRKKLKESGYTLEVPRKQRQAQVKSEIEALVGGKYPNATEYIIKPSPGIMQGQRKKYPKREALHPGNIHLLDEEKRAKHEAEKEEKGLNDIASLKKYAISSAPKIIRFVGSYDSPVKQSMRQYVADVRKLMDENNNQHVENKKIIANRLGTENLKYMMHPDKSHMAHKGIDAVKSYNKLRGRNEVKELKTLQEIWLKAYEQSLKPSMLRNLWELYETPPWRKIDTILIQQVAVPAIKESIPHAIKKIERTLTETLPSSQDIDKLIVELLESKREHESLTEEFAPILEQQRIEREKVEAEREKERAARAETDRIEREERQRIYNLPENVEARRVAEEERKKRQEEISTYLTDKMNNNAEMSERRKRYEERKRNRGRSKKRETNESFHERVSGQKEKARLKEIEEMGGEQKLDNDIQILERRLEAAERDGRVDRADNLKTQIEELNARKEQGKGHFGKSWFDTLKQAGAVNVANATPGLINNEVVRGLKKKPKKIMDGKPKNKHGEMEDEENEQLIIPEELDFWRD